jgi:hypothetical protein
MARRALLDDPCTIEVVFRPRGRSFSSSREGGGRKRERREGGVEGFPLLARLLEDEWGVRRRCKMESPDGACTAEVWKLEGRKSPTNVKENQSKFRFLSSPPPPSRVVYLLTRIRNL